jgi:hypothetical protein
MANKIDICNSGLIKLGVEPISSFVEQTKAAVLCKEQYDKKRRHLLRNYYWNFAIKRVTLTPETATPDWGFSQQFTLPSDFLRIFELQDDYKDYSIEGGKLLANASEVKMKYIADVKDVDIFHDDFRELLAAVVAHELAFSLTQSQTLKQQMADDVAVLLRDARSIDSMEQTQKANIPINDWVRSREGGSREFGRIDIK